MLFLFQSIANLLIISSVYFMSGAKQNKNIVVEKVMSVQTRALDVRCVAMCMAIRRIGSCSAKNANIRRACGQMACASDICPRSMRAKARDSPRLGGSAPV